MSNGTALAPPRSSELAKANTLERVVIMGDLSQLNAGDKVSYYNAVCESVGLNPLTRPFEYTKLNNREVLYARREATEQLRKMHQVSITILERKSAAGIHLVTARASLPNGRTDEALGAVNLGQLQGEALCNALMKAETKAKRRATLSICWLGFLDETEVEDARAAQALAEAAKPRTEALIDQIETALVEEAPVETVEPTTAEPAPEIEVEPEAEQPADVRMPDPCSADWIVDYALSKSPEGWDTTKIKTNFRLLLSKTWAKCGRPEQVAIYNRINDGTFFKKAGE